MIRAKNHQIILAKCFMFLITLVFVTAGCVPLTETPSLTNNIRFEPTNFSNIPYWDDDDHEIALEAFNRSCKAILNNPYDTNITTQNPHKNKNWFAVCEIASTLERANNNAAKKFFEKFFVPYSVGQGSIKEGLFTGYYEPVIRGSLSRSERYNVPLYGIPSDMISIKLNEFSDDFPDKVITGRLQGSKFVPYYTRSDIENGKAGLQGSEIAWLEDYTDSFFLHIQGSGQILFEDGSRKRISYAASNGHKYFAIGRKLIQDGEIPKTEISMQRIREWLKQNPSRAKSLTEQNPSYIFFRWNNNTNTKVGPIGSQGIPLTSGRSIAIDRRFFTFGTPIWLKTKIPAAQENKKQDIYRLVIAQDTGSAIKGIIRGDLFIGTGDEAGEIAGKMKEIGRYWVFLPKIK
ncbi:MAG: murein transglycosylase [Alphaproteobacteria bacterium]|nr:murein transglycosylase [Alphaproteobacteria bacterium]